MSQQGKRKSTKESSQPNKRVVLTHAQKHQLCLDSQKTPRLTQTELANLYNIKQNTVSDILKKKDKWLFINPDSEESNKQREKQVHFPQVEEALSLWITNALSANLVINGDILREKAKFFAQQFEITRFSASNGWMDKFKKWYNLKEHVKWGEANSAPLEILDEERNKLREILKNYDLNDVFNCDETGLYWDLEPSKTLAQGPLAGKKKSKKRVTLLFTCNATGTEKMKPLFIHAYQNPRALHKKKKEDLPVEYYWNSTSWMQVSVWNDYLTKLDKRMRLQNRKILLLVDNAPVHVIDENVRLTNVTVHFLLPNTTAHLQPCDAGIIKSFKAQYRKLIVRNRIEAYEISQELNKGVTPINICDAINFSKEAWDFVSQRTIVNCWRHTGILPQDEIDEGEENEDQADQEAYNEIELQELIDQLPYDDPMDAEEFLHIDDRLQVDGGLTDEEIVSIIKSNDDEPKTDPIEESPKVISKTEALDNLDNLVLFFEYSLDISIDPNETSLLRKLRHKVLKSHINSLKQTTLDHFIQIV
ncbi:tigger transposable element-derived protein 6-like [Rhizophagus clarus]|uniref:Tigger transposable element-derived protein 6-like n=2 Tax=Rhizophagus clarus TaxID=94130 RepID=A0A8H3QY86_9GLOM|nr:tigger transposable element-derived protein 6-like [Rhizophagus clarus]